MTPEKFDALKDSVDRIEKAIVGDPAMGHHGLAPRVERIERKLGEHDRKLIRWAGVFMGVGLAISYLTKLSLQ
jgi:hypothetical protein